MAHITFPVAPLLVKFLGHIMVNLVIIHMQSFPLRKKIIHAAYLHSVFLYV